MTFVKDGSVDLSGRAPQRNPLTSPGNKKDSAVPEARLKKSDRHDDKNPLKKGLKGGAGGRAQALNKREVQLGETTLMRQKDIVDLDREKTSLDTVIDRRVAEWNVLLLLKKDNEDGVLPEKRGGPGNTDLLHLMIGTAWRTHVEVTSKSIPIVSLKKAAE